MRHNFNVLLQSAEPEQYLFQYDGAPSHYAIVTREILDHDLQNRWVGRRGPIKWLAQFPDLTAYDYWLWGYLKERVYCWKPQYVDKLKIAIEEEIHAISINMYPKAMNDFPKHCQLCLDVNGEQFEAIKLSHCCNLKNCLSNGNFIFPVMVIFSSHNAIKRIAIFMIHPVQ